MQATERARWWADARQALDGLPSGGLNIAHEAVDRHAAGGTADRTAFRWHRTDGSVSSATYRELARTTSAFANGLEALGVGKGDRVFTLLGRVPELYITVLGTLKATAVACPLFSAFGPDPIRERLHRGDGRVLVTTPAAYRRKVQPNVAALPSLAHVLLVGDGDPGPTGAGASPALHRFDDVIASSADSFAIPPTRPDDMALLHFTSGTTGAPKGAIHVHEAAVAHLATARAALDFRDGDVFWCTADPGWVTGTSYGVLAPLLQGLTSIVDEGDFDADRWYGLLERESVRVWYTAPTATRMLMRAGADAAKGHDLSQLRFVASVGEPLAADAVRWGARVLGTPIHDNWWQTETGGILIANGAGVDVRPGSMGRPLPGVEPAVLRSGDDGRARVVDGAVDPLLGGDVEGELAIRAPWPSMFRGYLHDDERYAACFVGDWYLTGDVVRRDRDGWFWFRGRADDVIKSAGHLIGPCEVEAALVEHPAVAEAGVIGIPDPVAGEVVRAVVTLQRGVEATEDLRLDLLGFARRRLGPAVAPRAIEFADHLPHTKSGKILRRLLRARALGLPEGDLSTLEPAS
jgi:acetyl-CoA synthetase